MRLVDISITELEGFIATLTDKERRYYQADSKEITSGAFYVRGYWDDDKLVGISGAYYRYVIAFMTLLIIKEEYWGKGWGTRMLGDTLEWMKQHHIPYDIFQYDAQNVATTRIHAKLGITNDVLLGKYWMYNVAPLHTWAKPLRYPLLAIVWCYHILRNRNCRRGDRL